MIRTGIRDHYKDVKAFIKEESYPEYKTPRGIFSRSDEFKTIVAPMISAIEKEAFKHPAFIKKIPISERPKYILNRLGDYPYYLASDYKSYESHFKPKFIQSIEERFYRYMLKNNPDQTSTLNYFLDTIKGINNIIFDDITLKILGTRMSGEMNTSLGNGITNYVIIMYLLDKKGHKNATPMIEGDDGLVGTYVKLTQDDFKNVGLSCELNVYDDPSKASFCGLIFDTKSLVNICNPVKVLIKTPWVMRKYIGTSDKMHMALLKSKALSNLWQYPGCPIVQAYAKYLLRMTYKFKAKDLYLETLYKVNETGFLVDNYNDTFENQLNTTPYKPVEQSTRDLMFNVFHISPSQQLEIEEYFENKNDLNHYSLPTLQHLFHIDQEHNFYTHCLLLNKNSSIIKSIDINTGDNSTNNQVYNLVHQITHPKTHGYLKRIFRI